MTDQTCSPSRFGSARSLGWLAQSIALAGVAGALIGVALPIPPASAAFPQPNIAPVAWEIDMSYRDPRRIVIQLPGEAAPQAYWYMVYTATNNTDEERLFLPAIDLVTTDGRVLPANYNVPMAVFNQIKERTRATDLTIPQRMTGRLLVGEDQAKSSVAIWREPMAEMGTFTIYFGGLSGEIVPLTDDQGTVLKDADDQPILLRKTRQLRYKVRGDDYKPQIDTVDKLEDTWVMR